jgi:hypothetical protein
MLAWGNNWIQGIAPIENKTSTVSARQVLVECSYPPWSEDPPSPPESDLYLHRKHPQGVFRFESHTTYFARVPAPLRLSQTCTSTVSTRRGCLGSNPTLSAFKLSGKIKMRPLHLDSMRILISFYNQKLLS